MPCASFEMCADLPRSVNAVPLPIFTAPPVPFVPADYHGELGCAVLIGGFGDPREFEAVTDRIRAGVTPPVEFVTTMPYVALQSSLDEANAWGFYAYDKGLYVNDLSDEVIDILVEHAPQRISPLSIVMFYRLDAAYSDVGDEATAFAGRRTSRYMAFLVGICPTLDMLTAERAWVRSLWKALEPHMMGGYYVNAADSESRAGELYGPKYQRLVQIKRTYDPQNIFHRNLNIPPAT
jgi:hypothetical protein